MIPVLASAAYGIFNDLADLKPEAWGKIPAHVVLRKGLGPLVILYDEPVPTIGVDADWPRHWQRSALAHALAILAVDVGILGHPPLATPGCSSDDRGELQLAYAAELLITSARFPLHAPLRKRRRPSRSNVTAVAKAAAVIAPNVIFFS